MGIEALSLGETSILALALNVYTTRNSNDVYLIDEPEIHLNWHLEQQLFEFHRLRLLPPNGSRVTTKIEIQNTKAELLKDGIDIEKLPAWTKVDELRLVVNCAKHAEGSACQQLRQLRADLLSNPSRRAGGIPWPDPDPVVLNPLGGQNLYINLRDFEEYVTSVKSFWSDLASALPI